MGSHPNITAEKFPRQGVYLGQPVVVCFHYDSAKTVRGTIVRDDAEAPGVAIIELGDGRFVLTTECQYQPLSLALPQGRA